MDAEAHEYGNTSYHFTERLKVQIIFACYQVLYCTVLYCLTLPPSGVMAMLARLLFVLISLVGV